MIPASTAVAQKYATQMVKKVAGEARRLAPWGAPAGEFQRRMEEGLVNISFAPNSCLPPETAGVTAYASKHLFKHHE